MTVTGITGYVAEPFIKLEVAPLTGSTTILQAPYSWLVFTNAGTIAAQTVTLPTLANANLVDGQIIVISNFSIISSFSFTVAVTGWTNTTALPAGNGMWLAYSAPSAVWFVVNY